jgi:hypothetical protein
MVSGKGHLMDAIVQSGPKPRKHRRMLRIVLIFLAITAIAEPIVMYRRLVREKEERRAAAERSLPFYNEPAEGR